MCVCVVEIKILFFLYIFNNNYNKKEEIKLKIYADLFIDLTKHKQKCLFFAIIKSIFLQVNQPK